MAGTRRILALNPPVLFHFRDTRLNWMQDSRKVIAR